MEEKKPAKTRAKKVKVAPPVPEVIPDTPADNELVTLNEKELLKRLTEKVSHFDAEMILEAAMITAGVARKTDECFKKKEARNICLALIKRGGPAFAVGAKVYREIVG